MPIRDATEGDAYARCGKCGEDFNLNFKHICKEEKKPRLFYYEEAENAWCPVPGKVDGELICTGDQLEDGEDMYVRFKRVDMTDKEFASLPEC